MGSDLSTTVDRPRRIAVCGLGRASESEMALALEVGRLHSALAVSGERLLVPDEPATERLLERLGVRWARAHEPFHPASTGSPH